jgi:hypothetical protein
LRAVLLMSAIATLRCAGSRQAFLAAKGTLPDLTQPGYLAVDRAYLLAHATASSLLASGSIKAFATRYEPHRGRIIELETDQGWDPDPLYVEFEELQDRTAEVCR